MLLPLFVALGALTFDGVSYVRAQEPPRAQDVIDLPADLVAVLEGSQFAFTGSSFVAPNMKRGARGTISS